MVAPSEAVTGMPGYDADVHPPDDGETWLGITAEPLDVAAAFSWSVRPDCGAVVLFSGTVRDHAEGRAGVEALTYEAYDGPAVARLGDIDAELRRRWPAVGRVVLLHRIGELAVEECSVLVVAAAPHRPEAFAAARFGIDAVKQSVPIWKRETWAGGADWGLGARPVVAPADVAGPLGERTSRR